MFEKGSGERREKDPREKDPRGGRDGLPSLVVPQVMGAGWGGVW